ncbi:PHD-finger family protein [Candida parapsilosis]|uniref:PHD-type domain-containing protein n=2 Tax=Candida parapsilosis TaxID=5480 RepID=G8B8N9_CANPC|nr:uncharacterized protein CPAR2_108620 [Candida parapsilosis]KAF6043188.1 PHD-finger family protein [Candida parapsilosis]KAF6049234.1 PHD-finger family protein [Candida parapsilosis]KAF6057085.1 PHD-finger family protein [Candida parapsilosis]KAF6066196.1 PHD-finger family protein [Candida parapsilosis]CCE40824.1 hypothetical protein CPAR2_108620 [Candida parapsilosis]
MSEVELHTHNEPNGHHHVKRKKSSQSSFGSKRQKHAMVKTEMKDIEESSEDIAKQYKKFTNAPKYDLNSEELYCVCRKPDEGELMVACDGCEEWFHAECMNIRPELSNLIAKFYCKFCTWKGEGVTLWKRKCRLDDCYEPIMENSKYCSSEHGKQYMQQLLLENNVLGHGVVKTVLTHVDGDVDKLHSLGSEFPELEEVRTFRQDATKIDQFPLDVQKQIESLQKKIEGVKERMKMQLNEQEKLQEVKENVKIINEKLSTSVFPDTVDDKQTKAKSKKGKQKKRVELCLCDKGEHHLVKEIANSEQLLEQISTKVKRRMDDDDESEEEEEEEGGCHDDVNSKDDDPDWFRNQVCIRDKKKCYRHNGWWNLSFDDTEKLLDQLRSKQSELERGIDDVLRCYSIEKYNNK